MTQPERPEVPSDEPVVAPPALDDPPTGVVADGGAVRLIDLPPLLGHEDGVVDAVQEAAPGEPTASDDPAPAPPAPGWPVAFAFNLAKVPEQGEDADPILRNERDIAVVAVFDGMGGAGGTAYQTPGGPRTGAYLGARVARDVVERRMAELVRADADLDGVAAAQDVRDSVHQALVERLAELDAPRSALRSKLLRALPTTMALLAVHRRDPGGPVWRGTVLSAGDSRVYVLDARAGLQQLTDDDIRDHGDAMANLTQDSVLSNAMSADVEFTVRHRDVELVEPFLLVAATDGCFGYLPSPMHFEALLLATLLDAADVPEWSTAVEHRISAVTGDDAAMAVLGIGADLEGFRVAFADRAAVVQERWTLPLDETAAAVARLEEDLQELRRRQQEQTAAAWAAYEPDYARHLSAAAQEAL